MIPFSRPTISKKDLVHVLEAMLSDQVEHGDLTRRFEQQFAAAVGSAQALAVNSASVAFYLVFRQLELKLGDEVILPAYGDPMVLEVLHLFGAKPVFVDLAEGSYGMDLTAAKAAVGENTKALVFSHLFGFPMALPDGFLEDTGVILVEDCTQALGSKAPWGQTGSRGHYTVYSLDADNMITTGEGGMIVCRRKVDHDRINDKRVSRLKDEIAGRLDLALSDLQAAMGVSELSLLPKFLARRLEIAAYYKESLARGVNRLVDLPEGTEPNWVRFPVTFASPRPTVKEMFKKYRVGLSDPWPKALYEYAGESPDAYPVATRTFMKTLCVPLYPVLKKDEVEEIGKLLAHLR